MLFDNQMKLFRYEHISFEDDPRCKLGVNNRGEFILAIFFALFFSACTDYVAQIDEKIAEMENQQYSSVVEKRSSSLMLKESSSSVFKSSSSMLSKLSSSILNRISSSSFFMSSSINKSSSSFGSVFSSSSQFFSSSSFLIDSNSLIDSRDGQIYKIVKIGDQIWMAQNLNFNNANSYCYSQNSSNCAKYGRLYTWSAASIACPNGWHLPTNEEWYSLFDAVGGPSIAGKELKSTTGWNNGGNGSDAYGFSALPAGKGNDPINDAGYNGLGEKALFWLYSESAAENYQGWAGFINLDDIPNTSYDSPVISKGNKLSVRCLKN